MRALLTTGDQSLQDLMDMTVIRPLPSEWHNLEEWDCWLSHLQADETKVQVSETTGAKEFHVERPQGKRALPLVVARNGSRIPFATVDELDRGDQVLALRQN